MQFSDYQKSKLIHALYYFSVISLIALIGLCIAWEGWLAPVRSNGSWLTLKALPLLIPLMGILRAKRYTFQWSTMMILLYFIEGVLRGWSDKGLAQQLAFVEIALSIIFFLAAMYFSKLTGPSKLLTAKPVVNVV
jgi:uncharacterized membrane protein